MPSEGYKPHLMHLSGSLRISANLYGFTDAISRSGLFLPFNPPGTSNFLVAKIRCDPLRSLTIACDGLCGAYRRKVRFVCIIFFLFFLIEAQESRAPAFAPAISNSSNTSTNTSASISTNISITIRTSTDVSTSIIANTSTSARNSASISISISDVETPFAAAIATAIAAATAVAANIGPLTLILRPTVQPIASGFLIKANFFIVFKSQ